MNNYLYKKNCLIAKEIYDVTVVGGGSAGICAAIAAARAGSKTLLIENTGWLGGIGTTAAMVEFGAIKRGGLRVVGGIPYELRERMCKFGGAESYNEFGNICFAPETFAHVAMLMCQESGVEFLLHTRFVDSIIEDNKISGILIDNKEGMSIITSKVFIDCTGDGDVFYKARLPFNMGREIDGGTQPMTLVFFVNNVDYASFLKDVHTKANGDKDAYFVDLVKKAKVDGNFDIPVTRPGSTAVVPRYGRQHDLSCCEVFINGTNVVGKNGVSAKDLTEAEIVTRKQIYQMYDFLKAYVPGFKNCYISHVPSEIGVRETRRLDGAYILSQQDLLLGHRFEDTIAVGFNTIDIHQVSGEDFDLTNFSDGCYYDIPYRCLIPKNLTNLLVAGRCISVTHEALGAIRVMVNTMPIGQAAGTAAAITASDNCAVQDVPVDKLQSELSKCGAIITFD